MTVPNVAYLSDASSNWANAVADAINGQLGGVYVGAGARDDDLPDPNPGMTVFLEDLQQVQLWDGTGWVTMAEQPRLWNNPMTGITGGSTSWSGTYHRSDGWCDIEGVLTFAGTPSAMNPGVTLPFAAQTSVRSQLSAVLTDGAAPSPGVLLIVSGVGFVFGYNAGATNLIYAPVTLTNPFTWGAGDTLHISGRYRMASRYS